MSECMGQGAWPTHGCVGRSMFVPCLSTVCAAGKLGEVKDCDCEGGLRVLADVLEQDGLLWEQ